MEINLIGIKGEDFFLWNQGMLNKISIEHFIEFSSHQNLGGLDKNKTSKFCGSEIRFQWI